MLMLWWRFDSYYFSPNKNQNPKFSKEKHNKNRPIKVEPNDKKTTSHDKNDRPIGDFRVYLPYLQNWSESTSQLPQLVPWSEMKEGKWFRIRGNFLQDLICETTLPEISRSWNRTLRNLRILKPPMETPDPPFMTPRFQGLKTGGFDWHPGRHPKDS